MLDNFSHFSEFSQNSEKSAKLGKFDENSVFSHFSPGGGKMWKNRVFIGEGPRFPSIFRYFPRSKIGKKRSKFDVLAWSENREKSGKIGDFPGSGPNPGKRHFVRSLPKTLHFFATFPIRSNCNSLEPPFFPVFPVLPVLAGRAETCKIRGKMPILPYFRKVETKVKTAVFSLF